MAAIRPRAPRSDGVWLALLLTACGPRAARIVVTPPKARILDHGGGITLHAVPLDAQGREVKGIQLSWRSRTTSCDTAACEDWDIVTVDGAGRVTSHENGKADVVVSGGGAEGKCEVTVVVPAYLSLTGPRELWATGVPARLTVIAKDEGGHFLSDVPVRWQSSDPGVAPVDARGNVVPLAPGKTVVTIQNGDRTARVDLAVRSFDFDGLALGLTPELADALAGIARAWRAAVRVEVAGKGPPAGATPAVRLELPPLQLTPGEDRTLTAFATRGGAPVAQVAAAWTSAAPAIVAVTPEGVAWGQAPGKTELTARFGKVEASLPVLVGARGK